ncbi:MAG: 2-dehydropantoate 2-reductase [Planctomycetes bacterium]|nr:2-dehydropantoate 2-reductase [Planctomycetota bacterium]
MHTGKFTLSDNSEVFMRAWKPGGGEGEINVTSDGNLLAREPEGRGVKGVILCLHGVESHSEWFEEVAAHLQYAGYIVFAFDRVGWGCSDGVRGHLSSYAFALRQVSEIATSLRNNFGSCHLAGLSWGGLLAMYSALRRGILFDSVTVIAPGIFPADNLSFTQKMRVAGGVLLGDPKKSIPLPINADHFTTRQKRTEYIKSDPHRVTSVSASFCLETLKMRKFVEEFSSKRKIPPSQLLLAGSDSIIDNAKTADLLGKIMPVKNYEGKIHSLVFEDPERVASDILSLAGSVGNVSGCKTSAAVIAPARKAEDETPLPKVLYSFNAEVPGADSEEQKPALDADSDEANGAGKHCVIMGAGAIGSLVGGLLALGGHKVTLIGREKHADKINSEGLRLKLGHGERIIKDNLRAVTSPDEIKGKVDLLIFSVKGFDTEKAIGQVAPIVSGETAILSLQNGLGNEPKIKTAFPGNILIAGMICAYTEFLAPGEVAWKDDRGGIAGAPFQSDAKTARAVWESLMPDTGMESPFFDCENGALRLKWSKLMLNVAFNALNAVTGLPTGEILAHPEYGSLSARALREGFAVMQAKGIEPLDMPGYPVRALSRLCRLPVFIVRKALAWKTGKEDTGASSMRQDMQKKRGFTEIDDINGAVVAAGAECGIPTPANEKLCEMVKAL